MGRLQEAEGKLTEALASLEKGTGDQLLRARILELLAQLHRAQRLFPQALTRANEASELCRQVGDQQKLATLVLIRASILGEKGDTAGAIEALQDLLNSVPKPVMGEKVYWCARQNLCQTLVENDQLWEARRELRAVRKWARRAGASLITARLMWTEALLVAREGDPVGATLRLEQVRDTFLRRGLPYDAALACLDLAAVHLEKGHLTEARDLASVLAPVFRAGGIHREALASLRLVARALAKKAATAEQIELLQQDLTHQRQRASRD